MNITDQNIDINYKISKAKGAYLWDAEGKRYVDYTQANGSLIHGHANSEILQSIQMSLTRGIGFTSPTAEEDKFTELVINRVEGCEALHFFVSETAATMSAIKLAKLATGRSMVVKFEGSNHGRTNEPTLICKYNYIPTLDQTTACVIVEPIQTNIGLVLPEDGFLQGLRKECDKVGAILIFDESVTGFRVAYGGASGLYNVVPDLWCFGRVIGAGFPIGAVAGKKDLIKLLTFSKTGSDSKFIFNDSRNDFKFVFNEKMSASSLVSSVGVSVLSLLNESSYMMLEGRGRALAGHVKKAFDDVNFDELMGVKTVIQQCGSLVSICFDQNSFKTHELFFKEMLNRHIVLPFNHSGLLYPSLSHSWDDIEATGDIVAAVAATLCK